MLSTEYSVDHLIHNFELFILDFRSQTDESVHSEHDNQILHIILVHSQGSVIRVTHLQWQLPTSQQPTDYRQYLTTSILPINNLISQNTQHQQQRGFGELRGR